MPLAEEISAHTLNRLSVYLRCLRQLEEAGIQQTSSQELARLFHLSATQIRKDLTQFGEFGIRGVGYEVTPLKLRIEEVLGLGREHLAVVVGGGNIGTALVRFLNLNSSNNSSNFRIVAVFDNAPAKIGTLLAGLTILPSSELAATVQATGAALGILAVPASAAQENYEQMVAAGIRAILNFAPVRLPNDPRVRVKSVDLLIFLEELAFFLR